MATKITIANGTARAVYDDRFLPLLEALGTVEIARASEVEFDHAAHQWVAIEVSTGREIARGRNRGDVIAREVEYLERSL